MFNRLRTHVPILITAIVVSTVFATGPTIAQAAYDAVNADKVDGKHAVGSGATVTSRKGKLVATSPTTGKLPNNIIAKAPNSDKLDGIDSTGFLRRGVIEFNEQRGWVAQNGGGVVQTFSNLQKLTGDSLYYLPLTTPGRIGTSRFYLESIEICYNAVSAGHKIDATTVTRSTNENFADQTFPDQTDRTSLFPASECYTQVINDTIALEDSAYSLQLLVVGEIRLIRVTSQFRPM